MTTIYLLLLIPLLTPPPPPLAIAQADDVVNFNLDSRAQVIIVVVVAAFLITAFLSVCLYQCYYGATAADRGIPLAMINSFPIFDYSEIKHLKGELSCAVCVSEFEDGEKLRLLTRCDHVFHPECIDLWLASHSTCPICRANLSRGSESTEECNSTAQVLSEVENQNQIALDVDREPRERASGDNVSEAALNGSLTGSTRGGVW